MSALLLPRGADSYPRGTRVRVLRGEHRGQVVVVESTWADGGDMIHTCRLEGGQTEDYDVSELAPLTDGKT